MLRRPFQFSLKALLGLTLYVAVVAWLVRDEEPWGQAFAFVYVSVGCGQILLVSSIQRRWTDCGAGHAPGELWRYFRRLREEESRVARRRAILNAYLTLPTWATFVIALTWKRLIPDHVPLETILAMSLCVFIVLHGLGVLVNFASWMVYFPPQADWAFTALRLLNIVNSALVFGAVFLSMPVVYAVRF